MNEVQTSADNNDDNRASEAFTPIETAEGGSLSNERIQILDLHTCNPIVSYHNQMFTCSWADQIGTELVFASPNTEPGTNQSTEPLHRGPSFELIAANSVKILGRKAHITSSSGPGLVQNSQAETPPTNPASEATSQAPSQAGVPRRVAPPSHQAQFLKRLQDLKSAKGEGDTVRTVMSTRRTLHSADHLERLQGWTRTEAQLAEIQRLNERAARGDAEAQTTLNMMISGLQTESESESESGSSTS
jgi:hypothetical protein